MKLGRTVVLLLILATTLVTPSSAQVFWANYTPASVTDDIWCVTYANGTFAAVTDQGNLLTSANGLTWSKQNISTIGGSSSPLGGTNSLNAGALTSIAYGNGLILVSSDLKTWVSARAVTGNQLNGIAYGGGLWCAVGDNATVITSPDALNWTIQTVPPFATGFMRGVIFAAASFAQNTPSPVAGFIFCGASTGNGAVSGPGAVLFMPVSAGQPQTVSGFLTIGSETSSNLEAIFAANGTPVIYGTGNEGDLYQLVAVGWGIVANIADSNDFGAPVPYSSVPNVVYRGLTFGNGYWVAAGAQGTILSSTDGMNWTQRFAGANLSTLSTATLRSATYSSQLQRFVVTGTGGTILVSNTTPTVFGNVSTRGYVSSTQTFIGGFVVQGAAPRTVLIRGDGPALGVFGVEGPLPDPVLTVYNSSGTAIASNTGWTTNANPGGIATAALQTGAFALPNPSLDSALLLTLQPGAYTVQITSAKGNSGIALFEAYTN